MIPLEWSDEVAYALVPTLDGENLDSIEHAVSAGELQLYRIGRCTVVTENVRFAQGGAVRSALFIWAVSGRDLRSVADTLYKHACDSGYDCMRYRTLHPGMARMIAHLNPVLTDSQNREFTIWCKHAAATHTTH